MTIKIATSQPKYFLANRKFNRRLILSTYQDGTGMLNIAGTNLPGWRDFERAAALTFNGQAQEDKSIFDVLVTYSTPPPIVYGISCKMRRELERINRDGRVAFELSNSAGQFWGHLKTYGLNQQNYKQKPRETGAAILEVVKNWYQEISHKVALEASSYLVLSWSNKGFYQLFQFKIDFPPTKALRWSFPNGNKGGRCLRGEDKDGILIEWYGESGGQLKYYPLAKNALWASDRFRLEPLRDIKHGILNKVALYFPDLWSKVKN